MKLSSRLHMFKIALVLLLVTGITFAAASSSHASLVDRHGRRIPSIFYGASPNPGIALEYSRIINKKGQNARPCDIRNAIYRQTDKPRFMKASIYICRSHYQFCQDRPCGSCGGGSESWCYSDSEQAIHQDGYTFDSFGCTSGCNEEVGCDHP